MFKNIYMKICFVILIVIILFIIFTDSKMSDRFSIVLDYFKYQIISKNIDENIKKEKLVVINKKDDIYGFWKSEGIEFENRYEALIDENSMIIYKYNKNNMKTIYWLGSFNKINNIDTEEIISNNYKSISKYLSMAGQSDNKKFVYFDNSIKFESQYNDQSEHVVLKHYHPYNDRIRMIKYDNNRVPSFDFKNNNIIELDNYKISYPSYFDVEEENSRRNIPDNYVYNIDKQMIEKNLIILSPSNQKSYAELFIGEYENANINNIYDLYTMIEDNSINYNDDTNELVTFAFDANNNSIMCIFTNEYLDDNGNKIYGLSFENWMYMNKYNQILIIGASYSNEDTSKYDYISDFESLIKNINNNN